MTTLVDVAKDCTQCNALIERNGKLRRCRKVALQNSLFCDKHPNWKGPVWIEPSPHLQTKLHNTKMPNTKLSDTTEEMLATILARLDLQEERQERWRHQVNDLIESMTVQCDTNGNLLRSIQTLATHK